MDSETFTTNLAYRSATQKSLAELLLCLLKVVQSYRSACVDPHPCGTATLFSPLIQQRGDAQPAQGLLSPEEM